MDKETNIGANILRDAINLFFSLSHDMDKRLFKTYMNKAMLNVVARSTY